MIANELRGECLLDLNGRAVLLRPTFNALTAAEFEVGSLFKVADRAADGACSLAEMGALLWYCVADRADLRREEFEDALVHSGLASIAPVFRALMLQVLKGR